MENVRHGTNSKHNPSGNIANKFDVPVKQVLPVHPVEHRHVLGETQDP